MDMADYVIIIVTRAKVG